MHDLLEEASEDPVRELPGGRDVGLRLHVRVHGLAGGTHERERQRRTGGRGEKTRVFHDGPQPMTSSVPSTPSTFPVSQTVSGFERATITRAMSSGVVRRPGRVDRETALDHRGVVGNLPQGRRVRDARPDRVHGDLPRHELDRELADSGSRGRPSRPRPRRRTSRSGARPRTSSRRRARPRRGGPPRGGPAPSRRGSEP